jgi:hypothetical protein
MRIAPAIELSPDQRAALEQWARGRSLPACVVEGARIVLQSRFKAKPLPKIWNLPKSFPLVQALSDSGPGWARERCASTRAGPSSAPASSNA